MKYSLVNIKKTEYQKWDKLVDNSNEGTIFHKASYLNALNIEFTIFYVILSTIPVWRALTRKFRISTKNCIYGERESSVASRNCVFLSKKYLFAKS